MRERVIGFVATTVAATTMLTACAATTLYEQARKK